MPSTQEKLPFMTKVSFGVGSVGEIIFLGMFNTFIGIFYNQAIGLSNSLIGLAIMLAMLGDAITDPVVGIVSDRWKSRLGRRHPFLFMAPIPIAICLYLIFNPPGFLVNGTETGEPNQILLFAWLAFWTVVSRAFLTLYVIPHFALGGELTKNANERSNLFSMNAIFGYVAGAAFAFTAWGTFLGGESTLADGTVVPKHLDAAAYGPLVYTACGIVLTTIFLSAYGTKGRIPFLSKASENQENLTLMHLLREIIGALKNRNYAFLMFGFFFFMISVGLNETFNVFVNTYFWELETREIRWFGLAAMPAIILGATIAPLLMRLFDRKPVLITALIAIAILIQLPIDLRLLGWFPDNDSESLLPILLACASATAMFLAIAVVAVLSMLGDIADQNEVHSGLRQEGLIYSARTFFAKASSSAGHFLAGIILDLFVRLPFEAVPGEVDADIVFRLGLAAGPLMSFGAIVAIPLYAQYKLTRADHQKILDTLEHRRESSVAS